MISFGAAIVGQEEAAAVASVLASGRLTRGPVCDAADAAMEAITGQPCHVVSSGTAALHLALLAAGVGRGDEVIVPATSFVATANAVLYCGAKPVFVGIDDRMWTIEPGFLTGAVTPKTKAVITVNLYGTPPPSLEQWRHDHYLATGRRIVLIEDNAEGLGALRSGVPAVSDLTTYSFYGSKTVTCGEGGAVGWRDPLHGERVRHMAGQAQTRERYVHDAAGTNYRMTELQAAVLVEQLKKLDSFLLHRRMLFRWYGEFLPAGVVPQATHPNDTSGYWAYALRKSGMPAAAVIRRMAQAGVETRPAFPPMNTHRHMRTFRTVGGSAAHRLHEEGIVLPTHCGLTKDDVKTVCDVLERCSA